MNAALFETIWRETKHFTEEAPHIEAGLVKDALDSWMSGGTGTSEQEEAAILATQRMEDEEMPF